MVGAANRKVKIKALNLPPERQAVKMIEGEVAADKAAAGTPQQCGYAGCGDPGQWPSLPGE